MEREHLIQAIQAYVPYNDSEQRDQEQILAYLMQHPRCLTREDPIAHFTTSVWTVDQAREKTLMVYHKIYDSWSWIGGHADGSADLAAVAMRELQEETGIAQARLVSDAIFSLEILAVQGHTKKGVWIPSHLHLNVTYLAEADETQPLTACAAENSAVQWWGFDDVARVSDEPWMVHQVYQKLIEKSRA